MSKLPKLYRVVWLEFEWVTDRLAGGEHVQDFGVYYEPCRLVHGAEGLIWQHAGDLPSEDFKDCFSETGIDDWEWFPKNPEGKPETLAELINSGMYEPSNRMTIKERKGRDAWTSGRSFYDLMRKGNV